MTPKAAVVLVFGPDPDAPPLWWFALLLAPAVIGAIPLAYLKLRRVG